MGASLFQKDFYAKHQIKNYSVRMHTEEGKIRAEGDLYIPPCCLPFWCFAPGYHHFFSTPDFETGGGDVTNIEPPESDQRTDKMMQRKSELTSQISLIEQRIGTLSNENYSLQITIVRLEGQF